MDIKLYLNNFIHFFILAILINDFTNNCIFVFTISIIGFNIFIDS